MFSERLYFIPFDCSNRVECVKLEIYCDIFLWKEAYFRGEKKKIVPFSVIEMIVIRL